MSEIIIDRHRRVEATLPMYEAISPVLPVPPGISSSVSSIGRASGERTAAPRNRPELAEPSYMYSLISFFQKMEGLAMKVTLSSENEIQMRSDETKRLEKDGEALARENAQNILSRDSWSVLQKVAQGISAAGLAVCAFYATPFVATALFAASAVSFADLAVEGTVGWQGIAEKITPLQEDQKILADRIKMAVSLTEIGLGLVGGVSAFRAGALYAVQVEQVASVIQATSSGVKALSHSAISYSKMQEGYTRKKMIEIQTYTKICQMKMNAQIDRSTAWAKDILKIAKVLQQGIEATEVHN